MSEGKEQVRREARELMEEAGTACLGLLAMLPARLHWIAAEELRLGIEESQKESATKCGVSLTDFRAFLKEQREEFYPPEEPL